MAEIKTTAAKAADTTKKAATKVADTTKKAAKVTKDTTVKAAKVTKETTVKAAKATAKGVKKAATSTEKAVKKVVKKNEMYIQFTDKAYTQDDLVKIAKDVWTYDMGQKASAFKSVALYVKPEEMRVYFVVNGEMTGSFAI